MLKSIEIILENWTFVKFLKIQNVPNRVPPRLTSIFWELVFSKSDQIRVELVFQI